ncbi:MAG: saccharopine dehydrogenase family protein [Promethearchaeota archaeon]
MKKEWILYGAYGYTGKLIAREAISRGHRPVLGGRSPEKLIPLANELNLDYRVFDLENKIKLYKTISEFDLVFHAAGPYIHTSKPMVQACLKAGINYLDITGEIPVFEQNFKYDEEAREKGISIISGVGFDVLPTDCMAKYVSDQILNPTHLELAIAGEGGISPGTLKTIFEHTSTGLLIRENGKLTKLTPGNGAREVTFSDKIRTVTPTVWGDLITAYITTKIPNIIVYMPYSQTLVDLMKATRLKKDKVREWIEKNVHGPDEFTRNTARSYIWAKVSNNNGQEIQAWLETMEGYKFTAVAGVRSVEQVFKLSPKGTLTPALAFGKDFILKIPDTKRLDSHEVSVNNIN